MVLIEAESGRSSSSSLVPSRALRRMILALEKRQVALVTRRRREERPGVGVLLIVQPDGRELIVLLDEVGVGAHPPREPRLRIGFLECVGHRQRRRARWSRDVVSSEV